MRLVLRASGFPASVLWMTLCLPLLGLAPVGSTGPASNRAPSVLDNDDRIDINNLDMAITNHGSIGYDLLTGGPGVLYPRGTQNNVVFAAGLWMGAKVNGSVRVAIGGYEQEYAPGPMAAGTFQTDQIQFRNFSIRRDGTGHAAYLADAVPQGAPLDVEGNPFQLGDALFWSVFNDADPDRHTTIAGSTAPLGVEVRQSVFAFNRANVLADVVFVRWRLENKGSNQLDSTYVTIWADPDLGGVTDDLVGCDTTLSLGYCYNATNADAVYGSAPPAVGFHLLRGATSGGTELGMTSFVHGINGGEPMSALQSFLLMSGRRQFGTPMYVCDDPSEPVTTFDFSGLSPDAPPSCTSNWLDTNPSDRRFYLSSGPFTMLPGDTQVVIVAIEVGQSTNRLASVEALRTTAASIRILYDAGVLDPPTAVEAILVESHAEPDGVRLAWRVPLSAGTPVTVERRTSEVAWAPIGESVLPGDRVLAFEDTEVIPGERYGYRLAFWTGSERDYSPESWIQVPSAPDAPGSVRLLPGRPNPSSASFRSRHYVPRPGAFRLSVHDVQGRVIRVLENRQLAAGWHDSVWDGRDTSGAEVGSGVYVLRIEGAGVTAIQKLVLMR